jgi:uncharacterized protein YgiM (DUF1202 family)
MGKKRIFIKLMGITLSAIFFLSACNLPSTSIAPASLPITQTASPNLILPTATISMSPAATDTPMPAATATETATPTTELPAQVIATLNAYCRRGPGTAYYIVTVLEKGTGYDVIGRDDPKNWWQIHLADKKDCWVGDINVDKQGAVEKASIVLAPPLPGKSSNFVNSYTCDTALNKLGVSFNWAAVVGQTGYHIYRNGTILTDVGPDVTSYHDDAPLGVALIYELEPFNSDGVGPRSSSNVPACD